MVERAVASTSWLPNNLIVMTRVLKMLVDGFCYTEKSLPASNFVGISVMVVYGNTVFWTAGECCRTTSGHCAKLEARLSSGAISKSYYTSMQANWPSLDATIC